MGGCLTLSVKANVLRGLLVGVSGRWMDGEQPAWALVINYMLEPDRHRHCKGSWRDKEHYSHDGEDTNTAKQ